MIRYASDMNTRRRPPSISSSSGSMSRSGKTAVSQPLVSEDDAALFREAIGATVGEVRQFAPAAPAPRPAPPKPEARSFQRDEDEALRLSHESPFEAAPEALGDFLEYLRDGLPPKLLKRLKRGHFSVQDEIDLHRMSRVEAEAVLRLFLAEARRRDHRCVRIVHGKGLRSGESGPVLKAMVDRMLRLRGDVLAFASAPARDGGSGAVVVLLAA